MSDAHGDAPINDEELAAQAHDAAEIIGLEQRNAKERNAEVLLTTELSDLTDGELAQAERAAELEGGQRIDAACAAADVDGQDWADEALAADESDYAILRERGEDV